MNNLSFWWRIVTDHILLLVVKIRYFWDSKSTTDDVMIETMNKNNWHQFLSDSIRGALDNSQAVDENGRLHLEGQ